MSVTNAKDGRTGILAQLAASATTATTLYTAPLGGAKGITVKIANRSTATTFRVWIALAGASDDNKQYGGFDVAIGAGGRDEIDYAGLDSGDLIRVYAGSANLTFTAEGTEYK